MTDQQEKLLQQVSVDAGKTLQAITWLNGRVIKIEEWRDTHPRVCPMEKKHRDILKIRALEVAVLGLVLAAAQVALKLLGIL